MEVTVADIVLVLYVVVTALIGVLAIFGFVLAACLRRVSRIERALRFHFDDTYPLSRDSSDTISRRSPSFDTIPPR